jgi:SAM-dependent methyltransferase
MFGRADVSEHTYLLANRDHRAARRLELLGELFDGWTLQRVDALGIAMGSRCWEVGAGGASVPRGLAERVGASGHVLATDLDTSRITHVPGNVEVRVHDIARDPAPAGAFDLVHARLVLIHVQEREHALATMASSVRPGGWLLVEDADPGLQPLACVDERGPDERRANHIRRATRALLAARGTDLELGRKLPRLLADAGLEDVRADGYLVVHHPACAELELTTLAMLRDQLLAAGQVTVDELERHAAAVTAGKLQLAQPLLISAWARRPASH